MIEVSGSGFRVQFSGFSRFGVSGSGFHVRGFWGFTVRGFRRSGFWVSGFRFGLLRSGFTGFPVPVSWFPVPVSWFRGS